MCVHRYCWIDSLGCFIMHFCVSSSYHQRILLSFVLPPLKVEFMDKRMIPFLLPTIFLIAEGLSSQEFALHILPLLVPVFKMQEPVQVRQDMVFRLFVLN